VVMVPSGILLLVLISSTLMLQCRPFDTALKRRKIAPHLPTLLATFYAK
jgi:hypothetical protein